MNALDLLLGKNMSLKFFNLHGHSGASLYDAIGSPEKYAEWMIKNTGEDSGGFAITDHGNMNNIGAQANAQKKYDAKGIPVKMLYGIEAYYIPSLEEWHELKLKKDDQKKQEKKKRIVVDSEDAVAVIENEQESKSKYFDPIHRRNHLVLVAQNQGGLKNLFRLVSRSYREGFYKKPRIDFEMLKELNEGLIASTACLHPDTLIQTSAGLLSIKDVVEKVKNKEELFVLGFDENSKRVCFKKILWGDKTRKNEKLIKIKLKNGKELKLTKDHKVYTDKGWIEAGMLTKDHKILSLGIPPK